MSTTDAFKGADNSRIDHLGDENPSLEHIEDDKLFVGKFSSLYNDERLSDVILHVGDERFYAHKFMLIVCSEVFE